MYDILKKRLRNKEWRERNKENLKIKKKMDYLKNRERYIQYRKNYLKKHLNDKKFRESQRLDSKKRNIFLRLKMFELLGNQCVECGYNDMRALQIDHIQSNGKEDRKIFRANQFYRYYLSNKNEAVKNLQILCANCNHIKRIEKKEHRKPIYTELKERESLI